MRIDRHTGRLSFSAANMIIACIISVFAASILTNTRDYAKHREICLKQIDEAIATTTQEVSDELLLACESALDQQEQHLKKAGVKCLK